MAPGSYDETSSGRAVDAHDQAARRVLIVHNWHKAGLISGENRLVETDAALLRDAGVEVETYFRSNDEIATFGPAGWAGLAFRPTVSPNDARALHHLIQRFQPDLMHVYNLLPLISPWVIRTARAAGVPVVQTVNNYLHVCVAGTYFRDGRPCHDCRGRAVPWPAVVHRCYHESWAQSSALGLAVSVHRPTWRTIDRFLAESEAVARHLVTIGVDPTRISIRGDAVADPGMAPAAREGGALYVGRLRGEKGAHLLLAAWERSGLGSKHRLRLAGDGPDRAQIERTARGMLGVDLLGSVSHQRALELIGESAFVVVPSLWEEPGCTAAREAMARGRPVLATTRGVLPEIVDSDVGWVVEPTVEGLVAGLRAAFSTPLEQLGLMARRRYEERFSPPVGIRSLLAAYADVINSRRHPPARPQTS